MSFVISKFKGAKALLTKWKSKLREMSVSGLLLGRSVLGYYVRYFVTLLGVGLLGAVIVLFIWIGSTDGKRADSETGGPLLTEETAAKLAYTSLVSSSQALIACGLNTSIGLDESEVVYNPNNT
jgi:hypothetical protein